MKTKKQDARVQSAGPVTRNGTANSSAINSGELASSMADAAAAAVAELGRKCCGCSQRGEAVPERRRRLLDPRHRGRSAAR